MIVAKFGGTSIGDADGMRRCADIVAGNSHTALVVVSAVGKTTNTLERLACKAARGNSLEAQELFQEMVDLHRKLLGDLALCVNSIEDICAEARTLLKTITQERSCCPARMDEFYAIGERLSGRIFARLLGVGEYDARKLVVTDDKHGQADALVGEIAQRAKQLDRGLVVTQGFIGATESGVGTTLGREGSDYSATLLAEAIGASEVHIWTDVPGVFSADPNLVPAVCPIRQLSYAEAAEFARLGAKVLFPKTLEPAIRSGMVVTVASSLQPQGGKTTIGPGQTKKSGPLGLAISGDRLSFIGSDLDSLVVDLPEIERGQLSRTFCLKGQVRKERLVRDLHRQIFSLPR